MKRLLPLLVLVPVLSGCRVMAHVFERVELEHRTAVSREVLSESWNPPQAASITVDPVPNGLRLVASARQTGTQHVRVRELVKVETKCARRAVGGIFEAPDSFWGVCDDVWVAFAFLGGFLFTHYEGGIDEFAVACFVLGVVPLAVDVITFIPLWIAGHDWGGPCDYVAETVDRGEMNEERDEAVDRAPPMSGAEIVVRKEGETKSAARVTADADGRALVGMKDLVAWSRGDGRDVVFETELGGSVVKTSVSPGEVLNGPNGSPVDWRARDGGAAPDLRFSTRLDGATLIITVENRGAGDAWQVAAIVASDNQDADGRVAAFGRVHPGEHAEARISLPAAVARGALEFTEAYGHAPAAVPFGE